MPLGWHVASYRNVVLIFGVACPYVARFTRDPHDPVFEPCHALVTVGIAGHHLGGSRARRGA